ncbi:MAG TPA: hypothetical protein VJ571_01510 [Candidatus Nitrosotalea sp.]|nr:hypothetical protein [Candidatus Nitrosotalea sp.]
MKYLLLLFVILLSVPIQAYALSDSTLIKWMSTLESWKAKGLITDNDVFNVDDYLISKKYMTWKQMDQVYANVSTTNMVDLQKKHYDVTINDCLYYDDKPLTHFSGSITNKDTVDHRVLIKLVILDLDVNVLFAKDEGTHKLHVGNPYFLEDEISTNQGRCDLSVFELD